MHRHVLLLSLVLPVSGCESAAPPKPAATPASPADNEFELDIYDVSDLEPAVSLTLIESRVKEASGGEVAWRAPASCESKQSSLIVYQTKAVQRKVLAALRGLRDSGR
jgi:hypothetical protein